MHDTLFVTAHFHFTIVGAAIFALFAGFYGTGTPSSQEEQSTRNGIDPFLGLLSLFQRHLYPHVLDWLAGFVVAWPTTAPT